MLGMRLWRSLSPVCRGGHLSAWRRTQSHLAAAAGARPDLSGIYPPIATPFTPREDVDYQKLEGNLQKYAQIPFKALPSDVHTVIVGEEHQQEWSSSLDQEGTKPPHIKEEQEELWISQKGEQLQRLEEADTTKFTFAPVPVKSEDDEENPQFSQLHQRQTEQMKTGNSSEPETETDDSEWKEIIEPLSGLNSPSNDEVPVWDSTCGTGEKPVSCFECGKRFGTSGHLKRHMRSHTAEKLFSCSVCKKAFIKSGHLQNHMRIHTGEKPFSCSICTKAFTESGSLSRHMRIHTGEKPFSCSVCKKAFRDSGQLKKHLRTHTGEKPFSCSFCKKAFADNGHLQKHTRIHTGEKPFSCSVCKKAFTVSGHLKAHMRIHTGEKPFSCSVCKKAFTESGHLKVHMRTHTGEKPFICSFCSKAFSKSGHLREHLRSHTGEKPYSCSFCSKAFSKNGNLQTHVSIHTGENMCGVELQSETRAENLSQV